MPINRSAQVQIYVRLQRAAAIPAAGLSKAMGTNAARPDSPIMAAEPVSLNPPNERKLHGRAADQGNRLPDGDCKKLSFPCLFQDSILCHSFFRKEGYDK